jgi:phage nucleotide-binding protein
MPIVSKVGSKKPIAGVVAPFTLPTTKNVPSVELLDYSILLYGGKKIGKTSLAGQFPDALFLALEPGTKALRVYSVPVPDWTAFCKAIDALKADKSKRYRTVVIDTVDVAYGLLYQQVMNERGIAHPNDEKDHGATWGEIRRRFREQMLKVLNLKMGVIFISHETEKEFEQSDGSVVDRKQPTMSKQAMEEVEGLVDVVAHYHYIGSQRALRIDGLETVVAGARLEENFVRKGGSPRSPGDRIQVIPMGLTAKEAYNNFVKAFQNEQEKPDPFEKPVSVKPKTKVVVGKKN